MLRPLTYVLFYLAVGIICGQYFCEARYIALFVVAAIILSIVIMKFREAKLAILLVPFLILGIFAGYHSTLPKNSELYSIAMSNEKCDIECEILNLSSYLDNTNKYVVKILNVNNKKLESKALLYYSDVLTAGDVINVHSKITPIAKKANPTDFNSYGHYKSYNIEYKISSSSGLEVIGHNDNFNAKIMALRNHFVKIYDRSLPDKESSFIKAVVLGDKSALDENLSETFREAGVSHIMAISGLHISIFAAILLVLLRNFHKVGAYITVLIFLALYSIFTGLSPSVVRASLMTAIMLIGRMIGREYDILSAASLACIVLLLVNPFNLCNIGFCYSFICVFAIGMLIDVLNFYKLSNKKLFCTIMVSFIANIASKPFTVYNFFTINPYDIISNIVIVPFMSVTLSVGLVTALAGSISIDIARFFAGSIYVMVNFYEFVCDKVNSLPHHLIEFGGISIFTLLLIYMLYIVIYNIIIKEINVKSICIPTALIFVVVANFYLNRNIVTYIDTNYAKNMVTIDGNFCRMVNFGSRSSAGLGKQRILRYLKYKHINRINELYILKGNYYFVGGYLECAADINVDKIYVLESCKQDSMYNRLLRAAEDNGAEIVYVDENDIPKEYFELLNYEDT